jgi:hypothetical protein
MSTALRSTYCTQRLWLTHPFGLARCGVVVPQTTGDSTAGTCVYEAATARYHICHASPPRSIHRCHDITRHCPQPWTIWLESTGRRLASRRRRPVSPPASRTAQHPLSRFPDARHHSLPSSQAPVQSTSPPKSLRSPRLPQTIASRAS